MSAASIVAMGQERTWRGQRQSVAYDRKQTSQLGSNQSLNLHLAAPVVARHDCGVAMNSHCRFSK
jgi:hypothetical protein